MSQHRNVCVCVCVFVCERERDRERERETDIPNKCFRLTSSSLSELKGQNSTPVRQRNQTYCAVIF